MRAGGRPPTDASRRRDDRASARADPRSQRTPAASLAPLIDGGSCQRRVKRTLRRPSRTRGRASIALPASGLALPFWRHGEQSVAGHNLVADTVTAPDSSLRPAIALKSNAGQIL